MADIKTSKTEYRMSKKCYFYIKRYSISNSSQKPDYIVTAENFQKIGKKVEVFVTFPTIIYTDYYDLTIKETGEQIVSEKPVKTEEVIEFIDSSIPEEKKDWEKIEGDNFNICFSIFKDMFNFKKYSNKLDLFITLDSSIENVVFNDSNTTWLLSKFTDNVKIISNQPKTNSIILGNIQINLNSLNLQGLDIIVDKLFYLTCEVSFTLNFSRITASRQGYNQTGELSVSTRSCNIRAIELHGFTNIIITGILDTQSNYIKNSIDIHSIRYMLTENSNSKSKRNVLKISNFYKVNISYIEITKEFKNIVFFHIFRCSKVSITGYKNHYISKRKKGTEILCESVRSVDVTECSISSSIDNSEYFFMSFSKMEEDASISIINSNFANVCAIELLSESYGKILLTNTNCNSKQFIKTYKKPIYNLEIDSCKINCEDFNLDGINKLLLNKIDLSVNNDINIICEKLIIEDSLIKTYKNIDINLEGNLDLSPVSSTINTTAVECKNFYIHSKPDLNCSIKYEDTKIYCNLYKDEGLTKVIMNSKVIIKSQKYEFKSVLMKSNSEQIYIRCDSLSSSSDSILINSQLVGTFVFEMNSESVPPYVYINFEAEELKDDTSFKFLFDGIQTAHSKKEVFIKSNNYFLDSILQSNKIDNLIIHLELEGENCFEGSRVFYRGNSNCVYKLDKIESSDLEKIENIDSKKIPAKTIEKFKYGVIKDETN